MTSTKPLAAVRTLLLAVALVVPVAEVSAQSGAFVEVSAELSSVSVGTQDSTWRMGRLAGGVNEEGRFGWTLSGERHARGDRVDTAYQVAGFRRAGDWTVAGSLGFALDPTFLYTRSVEGEVARRVVGGLVVHGALRHLTFPEMTVQVVQPAVSWYLPRGDVHARGFLVRNATTDRRASTVLVRGSVAASSRTRVSAGLAFGTRIFDVASFSAQDADAWVAFATVRMIVTPHLSIDAGVGGAHEEPLFSQRTASLGARWTF